MIKRIFHLFYLLSFVYVSGFCQDLISLDNYKLFDGVSLDAWQVVQPNFAGEWFVKDSTITCGDGTYDIKTNTFLVTKDEFRNFEFRCLFRLSGDPESGLINSGIQYRSKVVGDDIIGYQADIGDGYWGDIYEENGRALLVPGDLTVLNKILKRNDWNSYIIRCIGDVHEIYINGVRTAKLIDKDPGARQKGVIGFQNHSGGKCIVEFKDIEISIFDCELD